MKTMIQPEFNNIVPLSFQQWQAFARNIRQRSEVLSASRIEQGFALAKSVGIHRDMCCVHNASIDDDLQGWCFNNPHRLKIAKQANYMLTKWCWEPTQLANRIIHRAWLRVNR